jgi:peroxiredoxin
MLRKILLALLVVLLQQSTAVGTQNGASSLRLGQLFPEFKLTTFSGERKSTNSWRGRPVVLNVWATWCASCRTEMSDLQRLSKDPAWRGIQVIGVSVDTDAFRAREFVRDNAFAFAGYLDEAGEMSQIDRILPRTYIIDADGRLKAQIRGRADMATLRAAVAAF